CRDPQHRLRELARGARILRPQLSRLRRVRHRSLHLLGQGGEGRGAGAQHRGVREGQGSGFPPARGPGRDGPRAGRENLRQDRAARVPADRAHPRFRRGAPDERDGLAPSRAAVPAGRHHRVERAQAPRQALPGLQHVRARQDAQCRLLRARASRRAGVHAAHVGRAGPGAPARFPHGQRARAPGGHRRPLARCARAQARPGARPGRRAGIAGRGTPDEAGVKRGKTAGTPTSNAQEKPMAARSIASLTLSFGLVSIPVKLYSATRASGTISFNLLHQKDGSRLRQQYVCVKEDVVVPREEIVKGYEFAKDQYVMFTPEELKALEEMGSHSVDIVEFVPLSTVDPVYFDKAYYLGPDKGGAKPYALFARALADTGRCAIGRYAARGKQYIVMLRPIDGGLVMQQLLYNTEVRSIDELEVPKAEVRE